MQTYAGRKSKKSVRDQWVPFDRKVINAHYKLQEENYDQFKSLCNNPNYDMILEHLTENRGQWKHNPSGQVVSFPSKSLSYIGKIWNHFIANKNYP